MSIESQEKTLFDSWKDNVHGFIADGIIDETSYLNSFPRVLYLLKEANGGNNWSLKDYIRAGARAQTWNNIARWQYGIQNIETDISWYDLANISSDWRKKQLMTICAVNIKKQSGNAISDWGQLRKSAIENKEYLKLQLHIYEPDLIICCGTNDIYLNVLYENTIKNIQTTSRGISYAKDGSKTIISYVHPEARVKDSILYYGLIDAVKEILLFEK